MLGIGWGLLGPERLNQPAGIDRRKAVEHKIREQ